MTQDLLNWLEPAFEWLRENWPEDEPWEAVKPAFLAQLGVNENDVDEQPTLAVLRQYLREVDELGDDEPRREALLNENARRDMLERIAAEQPESESQEDAAGEGEDATRQYVDGIGWMNYDQTVGQWVAEEQEGGEQESDEAAPAETVDLNAFYLNALQAIEAEDPELAEQIRNDPDLQAQIFADARAELEGAQQ